MGERMLFPVPTVYIFYYTVFDWTIMEFEQYVCLSVFVLEFLSSVEAFSRPNIVFILADDLGFNDVGFHGSLQIPTPNIDALASSGIILNQYYGTPLCTPSRSAIMTGKHPIHTGMQHDVIYAAESWGLPLNIKLLPEYLKELGYQNFAVGKWHLGQFNKRYLPVSRGFIHHYGYWTGHKDYFSHNAEEFGMWGLDLHDGLEDDWSEFGNYTTRLFTRKAEEIIENHSPEEGPLFLYLAHLAVHSANPHSPLQAPRETVKRFEYIEDKNRRIFAAMVYELDLSIGRVVKKLSQKNLLKDTIIVFSSDNGGPAAGFNQNAASNWPLKGVKNTPWEGGVRMAGLVWANNLEQPGRVYTNLMDMVDWLPTLYGAAGANCSSLKGIDGVNHWPTLTGKSDKPPRTKTVHNIDEGFGYGAVRKGPWKLVQGTTYNGDWDKWFGPSGRDNFTIDWKHYKKLIADSDTAKSLARIGARFGHFDKIVSQANVKCSNPPDISNCKPKVKPCLFNIERDPCEYEDVADKHPKKYTELLKLLEDYKHTQVPPRNKPQNPLADPKYFGYVWTYWADYLKI
ncbi:hypothetical protein QYM36_010237 [Artemia franciscana]|uniref:Sulfatase N-terminal domain-containing protein n=2 Tax=Artemia franciscana TaxID=6661 RepID=A0AA88HPG4_ARTSF|nr:hypothetical protein QYM36_010237 [Artemia franciscana]